MNTAKHKQQIILCIIGNEVMPAKRD
uniref:Uncharacterized protein n=1 Tax=Arundo donax TaxID=35708 RepID=A0A0A9GRC9_ARUDO